MIRNPTAPQTEFTIQPGDGIERVSFQLVVDDGEQHSAAAQIDFLMPDVFHVNRIGISDTVCIEIDDCPVFSAPPPIVRFATQVVQGWAELINVEAGDQLTFSLVNPRGEFVRSTTETVATAPGVTSFWRFVWSTIGFELIPGDWTAALTRNGAVEATVEFRVVP